MESVRGADGGCDDDDNNTAVDVDDAEVDDSLTDLLYQRPHFSQHLAHSL
jgi:hypothetical protein